MTPDDIKLIVKDLIKHEIQDVIKDTAYMVNQSTKQENSGLTYSLKSIMDLRFGEVTTTLDEIKTTLRKDYVTRQEIDPIKKIVYGVVSLILTAVMGAILFLVLK